MSQNPQLPLNFDFRPSMSGDDFLVSDCNTQAVQWLDRWPDWPSPFLVIYGEAGCGKTHLAEVFRQATGAVLLDLADNDPYAQMGQATTGVVDDIDGILANHEQALFHLYNFAKENGAQILITSKSAPADWQVNLPDLRSRMGTAPAIEIGQPDDRLMEAVVIKLFSDRQLQIEPDVSAYMLSRMERSFDQARTLVAEIDRQSLSQKRKITIPLVRSVLQDQSVPA
ncbi:DnaA/Hda family protein [Terasakiella sp. A23]|uniref:HdaA/DnaA family protein n=1 Tax=Terasakiella sp. FCG-A23 TaxID=3080561 RepID=UPI002952BB28|nr:DnaA/Hda family protein [Terasakiella sp. A23]MDV7340181.1 DnaA/Hda family protein [Terasakiella sp. A23]